MDILKGETYNSAGGGLGAHLCHVARSGRKAHPPTQTASPGQDTKRADRNPNPSTYQTLIPYHEKPGEDEPQTQARAPHNSRKPSVYSPDTEAARAM